MASWGENQFSSLIEYAQDIIIVVDATGTISYVNPAVEAILGYRPDELTGENAFELIHPEDRDAVASRFESLVDRPGEATDRVQHRLEHANGDWRWVESIGSNHTDDELDGYVINSRDVTERVEQIAKLERQNERLDQFASIVSHDLRNPLNVATGRLELTRRDCESEHLDAVARAHDRIEELIDDLLSLARIDQEMSDLGPVDLESLTARAWESVETGAGTLVTSAERAIEANRSRLQQLLENLVRNAVEHGGEDVTVTVGSIPDGFYVEDDGPGIPADDQNEVFDAGYSTSEEGTGFGLSIVEQVAEAHDWGIEVTEGTDGGARFEITGVEFVDS
jgi:PAS domain S-box-containing protein